MGGIGLGIDVYLVDIADLDNGIAAVDFRQNPVSSSEAMNKSEHADILQSPTEDQCSSNENFESCSVEPICWSCCLWELVAMIRVH